MAVSINTSLTLPSGLEIPNRLVKAAMTEGLASPDNQATEKHATLYRRWARGGIGLQLTGNVQIDRDHLERPGNVVISGELTEAAKQALRDWSGAAKENGGKIVMQISHAGRQTPASVNDRPAAPSSIKLKMPGGLFGQPRAMTTDEVKDVIAGFANAAKIAEETGFDGVQLHGAHGYLISQFLSPRSNRRTDEWGGPLANRARLLLESIRAVKAATSEGFSVSVKLNSTDFQKGGFSHEDCLRVIDMLNEEGLDFVEISGGNYEQPKLAGIEGMEPAFEEPVRESTRAREAYFANYARSIQERAKMPLMVTGGFRTVDAMNAAIEDKEADLIGIGRPLCAAPDLPQQLLGGDINTAPKFEDTLKLGPGRWLGKNSPINLIKGMNGWGQQGWFCLQLINMGEGREPDLDMGVFSALRKYQANEKQAAKAYKSASRAD